MKERLNKSQAAADEALAQTDQVMNQTQEVMALNDQLLSALDGTCSHLQKYLCGPMLVLGVDEYGNVKSADEEDLSYLMDYLAMNDMNHYEGEDDIPYDSMQFPLEEQTGQVSSSGRKWFINPRKSSFDDFFLFSFQQETIEERPNPSQVQGKDTDYPDFEELYITEQQRICSQKSNTTFFHKPIAFFCVCDTLI